MCQEYVLSIEDWGPFRVDLFARPQYIGAKLSPPLYTLRSRRRHLGGRVRVLDEQAFPYLATELCRQRQETTLGLVL